jgi:hypothetical protein
MAAMRSLSLTRSSPIPENRVLPSAAAADIGDRLFAHVAQVFETDRCPHRRKYVEYAGASRIHADVPNPYIGLVCQQRRENDECGRRQVSRHVDRASLQRCRPLDADTPTPIARSMRSVWSRVTAGSLIVVGPRA